MTRIQAINSEGAVTVRRKNRRRILVITQRENSWDLATD